MAPAAHEKHRPSEISVWNLVPAVSHGAINPIRVGLPPLAEQKRIVAKVEEFMALCDRLELQLQERDTRHAMLASASLARFADAPIPANLSLLFHDSYTIEPGDLRKAILSLAVQGKLIAQDPNDEPAQEVFRRVAARLPTKLSENPFLADIPMTITEESECELPIGWTWIPLGHVGIWAPVVGSLSSIRAK